MAIDAAQIRAARGLLDWTRDQLATACGVSVPALAKIEGSKSSPHAETLNKVQSALEQVGIVFGDNSGVKRKSEIVTILSGKEGYAQFANLLYSAALRHPDKFYIFGGQQNDFHKNLSKEFLEMHSQRMSALPDFEVKMLKPESQLGEASLGYIDCKFLPDHMMTSVPFYVMGDALAILIWEPQIKIVILDQSNIAHAYATQFEVMWRLAKHAPAKEKAS